MWESRSVSSDQRLADEQGSPWSARLTDLCIVVPAYNEEANLDAFYTSVTAELRESGISYRFLFVDDGSRDQTPQILTRLRRVDDRVGFLSFTRNFGLQAALAAGLRHASARAVIVMDADLQDDPAAILRFVEAWQQGADVVYAVRTKRKESFLRRSLTSIYYRITEWLADIPIPREAGAFALYDQRVVAAINALPESNRYLPGLRAWVGFRQVGVPVERRMRFAGEPSQSASKLLALALDGVFSFSKAPLRFSTLLGFAVTGLAAIATLVVLYWRFVDGSFPAGIGQATIAISLLFLGGVQLLVLGVMGEYIGRVYDEAKRRPLYVVADAQGTSGQPDDAIGDARNRKVNQSAPLLEQVESGAAIHCADVSS